MCNWECFFFAEKEEKNSHTKALLRAVLHCVVWRKSYEATSASAIYGAMAKRHKRNTLSAACCETQSVKKLLVPVLLWSAVQPHVCWKCQCVRVCVSSVDLHHKKSNVVKVSADCLVFLKIRRLFPCDQSVWRIVQLCVPLVQRALLVKMSS